MSSEVMRNMFDGTATFLQFSSCIPAGLKCQEEVNNINDAAGKIFNDTLDSCQTGKKLKIS